MRVAVDTNVVVRYLTWDEPSQAEAAARVMEGAAAIVVPTIVLCEVVWVLRRAYRYDRAEIADALRRLITSRSVEVDEVAAQAGLRMLEAGGDFADGVALEEAARACCDRLPSLDRRLAELAGPEQAPHA